MRAPAVIPTGAWNHASQAAAIARKALHHGPKPANTNTYQGRKLTPDQTFGNASRTTNEITSVPCVVQVLFRRNQHSYSRMKLNALAEHRNICMSANIIMQAW